MSEVAALSEVPEGNWSCLTVESQGASAEHFALSRFTIGAESITLEEHGVPHEFQAKWDLQTVPVRALLTSPGHGIIRHAILARSSQGLRVALRDEDWPSSFIDNQAEQISLVPAPEPQPVAIFLVHGTFDGVHDWDKIVAGKVTFASELRSAFEAESCEIIPSLWSGTLNHNDRMQAASALARQIDSPEYASHRIFIVAHSHGGNIALAACGLIERQVEALACLATPHVYLSTRADDGSLLPLPVYCSEAACQHVDDLLCLKPQSDSVVDLFASLLPGVTTQEAVIETEGWRKSNNFPRFETGHHLGAELLNRLLGLNIEHDICVDGCLCVAHHDVQISSQVKGIEAHSAIHSRRVGRLLGTWFRSQDRAAGAHYLSQLVLPADSDRGDSVDPQHYYDWLERHRNDLKHSGWILTKARVTDVKPVGRKSDGSSGTWDPDWLGPLSAPDIFLAHVDETGTGVPVTSVKQDQLHAEFHPGVFFPHSISSRLQVRDEDLLNWSNLISEISLEFPNSPLFQTPLTQHSDENLQLELTWQPGHY